VVVEILSKDDPMPYVPQKCRAYAIWVELDKGLKS
jgi:hypothetical protein